MSFGNGKTHFENLGKEIRHNNNIMYQCLLSLKNTQRNHYPSTNRITEVHKKMFPIRFGTAKTTNQT